MFFNLFGWALSRFIPPRAKRLLLLTSLSAHIKRFTYQDQQVLSRLNQLMDLCDDSGSMRLPVRYESKIWGSFKADDLRSLRINARSLAEVNFSELKASQARSLAKRFLDHAPKYLHYGSKNTMQKDVMMLFRNLNSLHLNQA